MGWLWVARLDVVFDVEDDDCGGPSPMSLSRRKSVYQCYSLAGNLVAAASVPPKSLLPPPLAVVENKASGLDIVMGKKALVMRPLGWHLEEIHVSLAHLKKKRTRLQTHTKSFEEMCSQSMETASPA
nr:hypothetical protein [Tanacetum cinerariifolium]